MCATLIIALNLVSASLSLVACLINVRILRRLRQMQREG